MFEPNVFGCLPSSELKNDDCPQVHIYLKPRPNDRNMPTQHVAALLGATCCVRLVRHVGGFWLKFYQFQT